MTQDEIIEMAIEAELAYDIDAVFTFKGNFAQIEAFAKLVAAKALAQPKQEPRNVRERWNVEFDGNDLLVCFNDHEKGDKCQYERYSPQRTWQGLTDEDWKEIEDMPDTFDQGVAWAQARLKEKNT